MRRGLVKTGKKGTNLLIADIVPNFIHGFSYRKLRQEYSGNSIKVRRSNDNATTSIGFDSNILNESAIGSFVGANDGFKEILYDQIGSRNIIQETAAAQPKIVSSGSIIKVTGKPFSQFDGVNDFMSAIETNASIMDKNCTVFVVFESQGASETVGTIFEEYRQPVPGSRIVINSDLRNSFKIISNYRPASTGNTTVFSSNQPTSTKRLFCVRKTGNLFESFAEGLKIGEITSSDVFLSDTFLQIGNQISNQAWFGGKFAELLINGTSLNSVNMNLVEENIKDFYTIS